jgi:hypothetical protein
MRFHILLGAFLPALGTAAVAQTAEPRPRAVVHAAERAVSDDSLEAVRARWSAALATLDSLPPLLPPGESRERADNLCRWGHVVGALADPEGPRLAAQGLAMAAHLGERRLAAALTLAVDAATALVLRRGAA